MLILSIKPGKKATSPFRKGDIRFRSMMGIESKEFYKCVSGCVPINGVVPINGTQQTGNGYKDYTENYIIICGTSWLLPSVSNSFENDTSSDLYQCINQCASWNSAYLAVPPAPQIGECIGVTWEQNTKLCFPMKSTEGNRTPQYGVDSALVQRNLNGVSCNSRASS